MQRDEKAYVNWPQEAVATGKWLLMHVCGNKQVTALMHTGGCVKVKHVRITLSCTVCFKIPSVLQTTQCS